MKPHRHPYFQSAVISKTMSASTSASTSALWLAMVCTCSATLAQADEILFGDQTYHRVEVMGYEAGILEYRTTSGAYDKLPLDEIDMLVIDSITGVADFNAAEAFLAKGRAVQATERYERVLRSARGMWANITRVRLLIAADRAGLHEKAVRTFLDVAALEPTTAAKLLPMQLPQTRNRATARSLKRLEEMLGDAPSDETRTLVELLHYDMLRALGDPRAEKLAEIVAQRPIPANLITQRTAAIITSALSTQLAAGRVTETINEINALLAEAPEAVRAEWMLLKARAILSNAHQDDDFMRAASVAMRVAIHYADTAAGGEGLLIAAKAHEKSGRNPEAVRLLRECLRRNAPAPDAKARAREAIARLTAPKAHRS